MPSELPSDDDPEQDERFLALPSDVESDGERELMGKLARPRRGHGASKAKPKGSPKKKDSTKRKEKALKATGQASPKKTVRKTHLKPKKTTGKARKRKDDDLPPDRTPWYPKHFGEAKHHAHDAVLEVFSPPRLVPVATEMGLKAQISLDLTSGWDCNNAMDRKKGKDLISKHKPHLLLVSPPCTFFSIMHQNCCAAKMDPDKLEAQGVEARGFLDYSMDLCEEQVKRDRKFLFEHPSGASSWQEESVTKVEQLPGVKIFSVAQCRWGLRDPAGRPLQKLTKFMTNSMAIMEEFANRQCICDLRGEEHATIQGTCRGEKVSKWAQVYPPMMVKAIVRCIKEELC